MQVTLVDNLPVVLLGDAIDFERLALVDKIEKRRERGAKTHASPATVTDVEHPLQLIEQLGFIVEIL